MRRLLLSLLALGAAVLVLTRTCSAPGDASPAPAWPAAPGAAARTLVSPGTEPPPRAEARAAVAEPTRRPGVTLDATPADSVWLHVRDARTGQHLDGLRIHLESDLNHRRMLSSSLPPGPLLEDARSPVLLTLAALEAAERPTEPPWWVAAEADGYARGVLDDVDPARGGPVFLDLVPSGSLVLHLPDASELAGRKTTLRIWRDDPVARAQRARSADQAQSAHGPLARQAPERGSPRAPLRSPTARSGQVLHVRDLPAGPVRITLERGSWDAARWILAEAFAHVDAGAQRRVDLELLEGPDVTPGGVRVDVTLTLPTGWEQTRPGARLLLLDPPHSIESDVPTATNTIEFGTADGRPTLHLTFLDVPRGRARFGLSRCWSAPVLVGDQDLELRWELPEYAQAEVIVLDVDGARMDPADVRVTWRVLPPPEAPFVPATNLRRTRLAPTSGGRLGLRLPAGTVEVSVQHLQDPLQAVTRILELVPGAQRVTLRMEARGGARVRLVEGGREVPWPAASPVVARDRHGAELPEVRARRVRRVGLELSAPGTQRVRLLPPELDGYAPLEPIDLALQAGRWLELEVPLTPRW